MGGKKKPDAKKKGGDDEGDLALQILFTEQGQHLSGFVEQREREEDELNPLANANFEEDSDADLLINSDEQERLKHCHSLLNNSLQNSFYSSEAIIPISKSCYDDVHSSFHDCTSSSVS